MVHAGGGVHMCVHLEHVVEVPDRSGPAGAQVKQILCPVALHTAHAHFPNSPDLRAV